MQRRIKICGLRRLQDAEYAAKLGAWALGFIAYEKSRRYIDVDTFAQISAKLQLSHPKLPLVGVFVNADLATIEAYVAAGLQVIQLHGDETPVALSKIKQATKRPVIKAFRFQGEADIDLMMSYADADYILVDAFVEGAYGGTGKTLDWSKLERLQAELPKPLILSGGLTDQNIRAAWTTVKPFAVDLASGVERSPAIKEPHLMQAVFQALKEIT